MSYDRLLEAMNSQNKSRIIFFSFFFFFLVFFGWLQQIGWPQQNTHEHQNDRLTTNCWVDWYECNKDKNTHEQHNWPASFKVNYKAWLQFDCWPQGWLTDHKIDYYNLIADHKLMIDHYNF